MRAFEVSLNGKKICLAGIGNEGVLTTVVSWASGSGDGELLLEVGGLVGPTDEHVAWAKQKSLQIGDRVQIKVVEKKSVDSPIERHRAKPEELLQAKKQYVRMMAKKFGWKIQSRRKPLGG